MPGNACSAMQSRALCNGGRRKLAVSPVHGTEHRLTEHTNNAQQSHLSCMAALRFPMFPTAGGGEGVVVDAVSTGEDNRVDAVMAYALGRASGCSLCCAAFVASPACAVSQQRLYMLKASPIHERVGSSPRATYACSTLTTPKKATASHAFTVFTSLLFMSQYIISFYFTLHASEMLLCEFQPQKMQRYRKTQSNA